MWPVITIWMFNYYATRKRRKVIRPRPLLSHKQRQEMVPLMFHKTIWYNIMQTTGRSHLRPKLSQYFDLPLINIDKRTTKHPEPSLTVSWRNISLLRGARGTSVRRGEVAVREPSENSPPYFTFSSSYFTILRDARPLTSPSFLRVLIQSAMNHHSLP